MSFADVAQRVLTESGGGPMPYREITERAISLGYISPRSTTPWTYMASAIAQDIRRTYARGEQPRFAVAGRGFYRLPAPSTSAVQAIASWNGDVKTRLRRKLHEMEPSTFEALIGELLERVGYEDIEVTRRERDGGIDVRAVLTVGGLSRVATAIQVKRWKRNVPIDVVRALRGALNIDERGLVITTSGFTRDALTEGSASGRAQIGLIGGATLVDLLTEHELGIVKRDVSLFDIDEELFSGQVMDDLVGSRDGRISTKKETTPSGSRFRIFRVPGGMSRLDALSQMLALVEGTATVDDYLSAFQKRFPNITRRDMAERFMRVLVAFGLTMIADDQLMLEPDGIEYRKADDGTRRAVLSRLFLERIYGASEIISAAEDSVRERDLIQVLEAQGLDRLTTTQLRYLLEWASELDLVDRRGGWVRLGPSRDTARSHRQS